MHIPPWVRLVPLGLLAACLGAHQLPEARPSGFLGDYSQLRPGQDGQALLVYVNQRVDLSRYEAVVIDPITVWFVPGGEADPATDQDMQDLVDHLDRAVRRVLAVDWRIVERPGPGVLRVRVAITEAEGAPTVLKTVSALPGVRIASRASKVATGTQAFVGRAGIEAEVTDSLTGERMLAAVDRRAGEKSLGTVGRWDDVRAALDHWALRLGQGLRNQRATGYYSRPYWER